MDQEPRFVEYGRWFEAHGRLEDRIEENDRAAAAVAAGLAAHLEDHKVRETERRARRWNVSQAFLSGLALPLLLAAVYAVLAVLTARGHP